MKLDPLFSVKDNQLYTIAGDAKVELNFSDVNDISVPCELNQKTIYKILVDQKTIEPEAECYNEEYLASLRDFLKIMEEKNVFAVLCVKPEAVSDSADSAEVESYTACVKHATRRIKDCVSLAGVWLTDEFAASGDDAKISYLIDELVGKHAHYVYFASEKVLAKAKNLGEEYSSKTVLA
ncbi:hypothetical protein [Treponema sp.]|uniref:hypothetical protein n=1 Tax=Treponema sp. TaxID=166 RepID=UPI00298E4BA8|nr:hypothetical protein [Treponema sp.]